MSKQENKVLLTTLKTLTIGAGISLSFIGILKFSTSLSDLRSFFLSFYYIFFGILVCISEFPIDFLLHWFYFLRFYLGKGLFFFFIGTLTFTWSHYYFLIVSAVFFVVGCMYLVLHCCFSESDYLGDKINNNLVLKREKYLEV